MILPRFDAGALDGAVLLAALQEHGLALLDVPQVPSGLVEAVLDGARRFFGSSEASKQAIAERGRPPFRGYSRQVGERDHREQLHFGPERAAGRGPEPYLALAGPNQWPGDVDFAAALRDYQSHLTVIGRRVLAALAEPLGADHHDWLGDDPYHLLKVIAYPASNGPARPGVAAHVDWSLITLTLQDDVGGLSTRQPDGHWIDIAPIPGTWVLHVGELLAYVTGGRLPATPHRVVNTAHGRVRHSLPFFVNPSLDQVLPAGAAELPAMAGEEHAHAVLPTGRLPDRLSFGASEWARKAARQWCHACCVGPSRP